MPSPTETLMRSWLKAADECERKNKPVQALRYIGKAMKEAPNEEDVVNCARDAVRIIKTMDQQRLRGPQPT